MNIMKTQITEQGSIEQFLIRYKKWFIAALGLHMIPGLIFFSTVIGIIVYGYVGSDIRWHPYKLYITSAYNAGLDEGTKDRKVPKPENNSRWDFSPPEDSSTYSYLHSTLWYRYKKETDLIRSQALKKKDDYLAQFTESERGAKRAEMSAQDIKLPLELELEKRFTTALDFYTDYVAQKIKRGGYKNDEEHLKAMQSEAWNVGYEYGYARGRAGNYEYGSI